MKIQCDVCGRDEASVFCCADEAAICESCDRRVHHANKLARKHRRLSLSSQTLPLCDICKEGRGFVFCQEDRAILCKDCDARIHNANEFTMKHNRFLLTGSRLSATPLPSPSPLPKEIMANSGRVTSQDVINTVTTSPSTSDGSNCNASSISEYLIKMLPGYQVDDFLEDPDGLYKSNQLMQCLEPELAVTAKEFSMWAPHVPQVQPQPQTLNFVSVSVNDSARYNLDFGVKQVSQNQRGVHQNQRDDCFMVPQIKDHVLSSKRQRGSSAWEF